MIIIPMKCSNCGGSLDMSNAPDIWFCPFCGTKNVIRAETKKIDDSKRIAGLEKIVSNALHEANAAKVSVFAKKILDLDESNSEAWMSLSKASMINAIDELNPLFNNYINRKTEIGRTFRIAMGHLADCDDYLHTYCSLHGPPYSLKDVLFSLKQIRQLTVAVEFDGSIRAVVIDSIAMSINRLSFTNSANDLQLGLDDSSMKISYHNYVCNIKDGSVEKGLFDENGNLIWGERLFDDTLLKGDFENNGLIKGEIQYPDGDGHKIIVKGSFSRLGEDIALDSGELIISDSNTIMVFECPNWTFSQLKGEELSSISRYQYIDNVSMISGPDQCKGRIYCFVKPRNALVEYRVGLLTRYSEDICHFIGWKGGIIPQSVDYPIHFGR